MTRPVLAQSHIHSAIEDQINNFQHDIIAEVQSAIQVHRVVVIGMTQNPVVKTVKQHLEKAGVAYVYLEYGSYFSQWRRRLALKMWTGWPTYPMVFLDGILLGGAQDVKALLQSGELKAMLASK